MTDPIILPERTILFDADLCIFNSFYHDSMDKDVISSNRLLLGLLESENTKYSRVEVRCYSARSSVPMDSYSSISNATGSAFLAMQEIADELGASFNPFLMADVFANLPSGTSFRQLQDKHNRSRHHWAADDRSKLAHAYANIHDRANGSANGNHVIDVYDDLFDLQQKLYAFYEKYPQMIPKSFRLRLHCYDGNILQDFPEIIGTGPVDSYYRQTVADMFELTPVDGNMLFHCVDHITPQLLAEYRVRHPDCSAGQIHLTPKLQKELSRMNNLQRFYKSHDLSLLYFPETSDLNSPDEFFITKGARQQWIRNLDQLIREKNLFGVQLLTWQTDTLLHHLKEHEYNPLHTAVEVDYLPIMHYLIKRKPSLINRRASGTDKTALDIAIENEYVHTASLLIKQGAHISPPVTGKSHAIHVMAELGEIEFVQEFIQKDKRLLNTVDKYNRTTLLLAVVSGCEEMVEFLLNQGADPDVRYNAPREFVEYDGWTALDFAQSFKLESIVSLLISAACTGLMLETDSLELGGQFVDIDIEDTGTGNNPVSPARVTNHAGFFHSRKKFVEEVAQPVRSRERAYTI